MKIKSILWDSFLVVAGSAVFSLSVNMFSAPNNIVQGGLTGMGTVVNYLTGLPIGIVILTLNIPLFAIALKYLRAPFVIKTVWATAIYSLFIDLGALVIPPYKGDLLLGCIFCGVLSGIGLGLVFLTGATTGGVDIIAMLIRKKQPGFSMGSVIMVADFIIIALSFAVYRRIEAMLYAFIVIFIASRVIDFVLYGHDHLRLVLIITARAEVLLPAILLEVGRGASVIPIKGGYTGENKEMILCAAKAVQIRDILRLIAAGDPKAFVVVCDAGQIIGEGFQ